MRSGSVKAPRYNHDLEMNATHPLPDSPSVDILGTSISTMTMDETLSRLEDFATGADSHLVVTADATALVIAHEQPEFKNILDQASLITADSVGIVWAMKRAGLTHPSKVSGVELVDHICRLSADKGYRIYFLGAAPGVADLAADHFRLKYPGCNIVGSHDGYFPAESDELIAEEVAATKPDFLFVAMGMPRQEKFILKTQAIIGAKVGMGVGGSFDVYSGKTKRAPKIVQKMHMEWLWRLILNPSKISKVKSLPTFFKMVIRSK